jgi:uncharacterized protein (TIGR02145 family)
MNSINKVLFLTLLIFLNFAKCTNDGLKTVKIGNQEWLAEDLKTARYNNGDPIFEAKLPEEWEQYGKNQTGCFRILNNGTYIYNGFALADSRGILPDGFALPEYSDFCELGRYFGGNETAGIDDSAVRAILGYSFSYPTLGNDQDRGQFNASRESGFNAQKGGFVNDLGEIGNEGNCSFWWTSTIEGSNLISVDIGYCSNGLGGGKGHYPKSFGFAVRGLKKTNEIIKNQRNKLRETVVVQSSNTQALELINSIIEIVGRDFDRGTSVTEMVKGEAVMAIIPDPSQVRVIVKYRYLMSSGLEEAQEEGVLENFRITSDGPNNTKIIHADWNNQDAYAGDGTFTFRIYSEDEPQTIIAQIDSKKPSNWYHNTWVQLSDENYKKIFKFLSVEK